MNSTWLVFHITDRCQLNCKHCLRDPELKAADLSLDLITNVLDEAWQLYRCKHVGLTGGEPSLHPQFYEIIDAIVARGYTWHVVTNAERFARMVGKLDEKPQRLANCTAINFSIDGASEEVHDRVRGPGSFRNVMAGVALCKMRGIPFIMQMTLNAYNAHQVEAMALMASHLGADRMSFGMTQPTGTHLDDEMFLSTAEWRQVLDTVTRLQTALTLPVTYTDSFYQEQPFAVCQPFKSEILHVDPKGNLTLCCQHSGVPSEDPTADVLGNLHEVSLADAHRRMLEVIHEVQTAKIEAMKAGTLTEWDRFPCNFCMKHFKKPYWTDEGRAGAAAKRERWRGKWAAETPKKSA
jgi:MoaA/NifB/PqqE/SkfB family radical SAM enzyme